MKPVLIECEGVLTGGPACRWIKGGGILIDAGRIKKVLETPAEIRRARKNSRGVDRTDLVCLPGFVQSHIHLCQTSARGLADDMHLLNWLRTSIYPFEAGLTPKTMKAGVDRGLFEVLRAGTTCIQDMGSVHHTEVVAQRIWASGIRAVFGKCLMDICPDEPRLSQSVPAAMAEARALASRWHGRGDRMRYAFSPRFVLSCSDDLLKESFSACRDFPQSRFHTHASENPIEIEAVRRRCGADNIEHFERLGILSPLTALAHCVHVNAKETALLKDRGVHVLHCPSANLKLASGIADIAGFLNRGISVSIGTDGAACNNRLDPFQEMRLASLLQKPRHGATALTAREAFLMATYGGARALGWEGSVGSIEEGKWADLILVDLHAHWMPEAMKDADSVLSGLVYSGRPENVEDVLVAGKWLVRKGRVLTVETGPQRC